MTDKSHLLGFGYAPGEYGHGKCDDCEQSFIGDKYARRCEACAETLYSQVSSVEAVADKHRAMTTVPEEAVKAETFWAVNIHGPDDLIAAPDYMSAVRMANAFNAWWLDLKTKQPHNDAIDARMWAVPTDWEGNDARGHADELSKPHPEYQWLREALALPHLPGVGVKKLEWELVSGDHYAEGAGIHYNIYETGPDWWNCVTVKPGNVRLATNVCLEVAKAAAQADYEARILSALDPSAARELALEEARKLSDELEERTKLKYASPDGEECQIVPLVLLIEAAAAIRSLGTSCEQLNKAVSNVPDQQENEPGAHGERERALEEAVRLCDTLEEKTNRPSVCAAAIRSLAHADAGKVEGDGWLPIESAPKGGTEILAWRKDCGQFIASYTSCSAFPMSEAELDLLDEETLFKEDWFTQWPQALRLEGSEVPTHWRHLPSAPSEGAE